MNLLKQFEGVIYFTRKKTGLLCKTLSVFSKLLPRTYVQVNKRSYNVLGTLGNTNTDSLLRNMNDKAITEDR